MMTIPDFKALGRDTDYLDLGAAMSAALHPRPERGPSVNTGTTVRDMESNRARSLTSTGDGRSGMPAGPRSL